MHAWILHFEDQDQVGKNILFNVNIFCQDRDRDRDQSRCPSNFNQFLKSLSKPAKARRFLISQKLKVVEAFKDAHELECLSLEKVN